MRPILSKAPDANGVVQVALSTLLVGLAAYLLVVAVSL